MSDDFSSNARTPDPRTTPAPPHAFAPIPPSALAPYLADPRALVLDIRPHAAHAAARVHHALSLSVPTTLLKRPLFSLSKLAQMLPSPSSRARFADWSSASSILVYDSDSVFSPDNSIIAGLLRKFRAEGFIGELAWIRGGFQAVCREAPDLTTTEQPTQEEEDPDAPSSSGALRTTHLPKAAFSLSSTTAAPLPQLGPVPASLPITPAPSASRAANPFFDAIRQNVELSHGITERIPLRLPRRVKRRIHDLPFRWLQDIARRSALRHSSVSCHPGLDSFESGSESSDDPHPSDPDENDPSVEEGTEALAMQFYRIELAEQRRLRSIMEHHTKESESSAFAASARYRRALDKGGLSIGADRSQGGVTVRTASKSVPGTPHPTPFPFSITAGVEKGTKNRYTHIWPFEHARVRLHDGRHQGSHLARRDKYRTSERGRTSKDRFDEGERWEEQGTEERQYRSRSSPAFGKGQNEGNPSRPSFYLEVQSSITGNSAGFEARLSHPAVSPTLGVPRLKIEYDVTDQDARMSGPATPATALPLQTPPFYTPMELPSTSTPMRVWPPQFLALPSGAISPAGNMGGTQFTLPASSLPSPGPPSPLPLRLPHRSSGLLPSIGEQTWISPSATPGPFTSGAVTPSEGFNNTAAKRDLRRESSPVDDYVNASYVQPLGTRKRYIATQGPLPSTYVDFWTLVWEQNVHVIVMLTREVENAMVKCGSYWTDTEYGLLKLELLSTSPPISPSANLTAMDTSKQGFFTIRETQSKTNGTTRDQPTLITRTFALSHTSYPAVPPRRITHLQYLDWSDMNVPDDPRGVLDLIKKVEQAVAASTPGPSPSGSPSPASGSGSPSRSPSPDIGSDYKGYDTSLLSPASVGIMPRGGRKRRGSEWRHPELDAKTGIAAFALENAAPVLLHCSAGVGRTGGFIAVDAVLDGIRRELRKNIEEQRSKKFGVAANTEGRVGMNDAGARVDPNVKNTGAVINGVRSPEEGASGMDVDEPHMTNTVPIHVSTKGSRHHDRDMDTPGDRHSPGSESLVVHVPYACSDVPDGDVPDIDLGDLKDGWQPHSTRQWVEQVSDQTHAHAGGGDLLSSLSDHPLTRERSVGNTSPSSSPPALDSTDDSMDGNAVAARKSVMDSANGSVTRGGSGGPPPILVLKPRSGSASLSNSGSGTGAGSRFGSSLLHARQRDSSVTSISAESTYSHEPKPDIPLHQPSALHTNSSPDMEIGCPPRSVSAPLQPAHSSMVSAERATRSCRYGPMPGSSRIASISAPTLPNGIAHQVNFLGGNSAECSPSRPSLDLGSYELAISAQDLKDGERPVVEGSREINQMTSDKSGEPAICSKPGISLRLNTERGSLKVPEVLHSSSSAANPPVPSIETKSNAISPVPRAQDDSTLCQSPVAIRVLGASEHDQRAVDHPVIDYKLPRELHSDLSPPLISSFEEPICMVIQDMREQRMSLCQSLRQYVFVHAAIIEGALRIVDEEQELWSYFGASDRFADGPEAGIGKDRQRSSHSEGLKVWFMGTDKTEMAIRMPDSELGSISHRNRPVDAMGQPLNFWGSESSTGVTHIQMTSASSSPGVSSPPKGKRGPSPTELLREDKTGALSSNKRPSIHRKTSSDDGDLLSLESSKSSPVAGEHGGARDMTGGKCGARATLGRPVRCPTSSPT